MAGERARTILIFLQSQRLLVYLSLIFLVSLQLHLTATRLAPTSSNSFSSNLAHFSSSSAGDTFHINEEVMNNTELHGVDRYLQQQALSHRPSNIHSNSDVQFQFQLLDIHDQLTQILSLESSSGRLFVNGRLDRETLCQTQQSSGEPTYLKIPNGGVPNCKRKLSVLSTLTRFEGHSSSQSSTEMRTIPLMIVIEDINDNPPGWNSIGQHIHSSYQFNTQDPTFELRVLETVKDAGLGSSNQRQSLPLPIAHDPDAGLNGHISYRIEPEVASDAGLDNRPTLPFMLDHSGDDSLSLIPTGPLDCEKISLYRFILLAIDSGLPARTGSASIIVHVVDINDESPVFTSDIFYPPDGAINESVQPGTFILNVTAIDKDASPTNNVLRYSMVSGSNAAKYFTVYSDGRVLLKNRVDYESMSAAVGSGRQQPLPLTLGPEAHLGRFFTFQVRATDSAPPPYERSATSWVIIPVNDENDEPPQINIRYIGSSDSHNQGSIKENTSSPAHIAYVQVRDPDFNGQDKVSCGLSKDSYNFSLVRVPQIDETAKSIHHQSIASNDPSATTDYIVNLMTQVDRESTPFLTSTLTCTDAAGNRQSRKILVHVLDVNDEVPEFSQPLYQFRLAENVKPSSIIQSGNSSSSTRNLLIGHRVGQVRANDRDVGNNAVIYYYLGDKFNEIVMTKGSIELTDLHHYQYSQSDSALVYRLHNDYDGHQHQPRPDELFHIDAKTGLLYAVKSFDAENIRKFRMSVLAIDNPTGTEDDASRNQHTATAEIEIEIIDVNDWSPQFLATSLDNKSSFEASQSFITTNNYEFTVRENEPAYTLVGRIAAFDPDTTSSINGSNNKSILLKLASDAPKTARSAFTLHSSSGDLRTTYSLDRERQAVYVFTVVASDTTSGSYSPSTGSSQRSSTATVTVFVEDENDNDPIFIHPVPNRSVNRGENVEGSYDNGEGSNSILPAVGRDNEIDLISSGVDSSIPIVVVHHQQLMSADSGPGHGHPLLQLKARDADAGENGQIVYTIASDNSDNLFLLDHITGTLSLTGQQPVAAPVSPTSSVGTNTKDNYLTYLLRFDACDQGNPHRCAQPVQVKLLLDANQLSAYLKRAPVTANGALIGSNDARPDSPENYLAPMVGNERRKGDISDPKHAWARLHSPISSRQPDSRINGNRRNIDGRTQPIGERFDRRGQHHASGLAEYQDQLDRGDSSTRHASFGDVATGSSLVSETVIICLAIVFTILLASTIVLVCLIRRKAMFYRAANKHKTNLNETDPTLTGGGGAVGRYAAAATASGEQSSTIQHGPMGPYQFSTPSTKSPVTDHVDPSEFNSIDHLMVDSLSSHPLTRRNSEPKLGSISSWTKPDSLTESVHLPHYYQQTIAPVDSVERSDTLKYDVVSKHLSPRSYHHPTRPMSPCWDPLLQSTGSHLFGSRQSVNQNNYHHSPLHPSSCLNSPTTLLSIDDRSPNFNYRDESAHQYHRHQRLLHSRSDSLPAGAPYCYNNQPVQSKWSAVNAVATMRRHNRTAYQSPRHYYHQHENSQLQQRPRLSFNSTGDKRDYTNFIPLGSVTSVATTLPRRNSYGFDSASLNNGRPTKPEVECRLSSIRESTGPPGWLTGSDVDCDAVVSPLDDDDDDGQSQNNQGDDIDNQNVNKMYNGGLKSKEPTPIHSSPHFSSLTVDSTPPRYASGSYNTQASFV